MKAKIKKNSQVFEAWEAAARALLQVCRLVILLYKQRCSRSLGKSVCRVWCRLHYSRNHCKPCHRGWYRLHCSRSHHILHRPGWYKLRCIRNLGRLGYPGRCKLHRSRNLCKCMFWRKILLREQRRTARRRRGIAGRKVCTGVSSFLNVPLPRCKYNAQELILEGCRAQHC